MWAVSLTVIGALVGTDEGIYGPSTDRRRVSISLPRRPSP
jgi:hypothetical protein